MQCGLRDILTALMLGVVRPGVVRPGVVMLGPSPLVVKHIFDADTSKMMYLQHFSYI